MEFLNNLNCPQFVNFNSKVHDNNCVMKGLEGTPSSYTDKDDTENESMDTENSYYLQSYPGSLQSTFSESYLGVNSPQENAMSVALSCQSEDFPVNRPKNISLPERAPKKNTKVKKTTKVQPFHFAESKKRKRNIEESGHVPLAEQVAAFHKKTPQRFHTTGPKSFQPMEHWSPPSVHPISPVLHAAKRQRKLDVLSRDEIERKEAEEMKRYRFRARPVNQSILHQPHLLQVGKRTPIKSKTIHLRTAQRAAEMHSKKKVDEKPYEFHARPVPKAIFTGPKGLKEKTSLPVTEAKTPNFALKSRAEKWKSENKLDETAKETQKFKALPAPAPSSPFVIKHEKKHTEIQPFSFDSKDKERIEKKEKKIQEEVEKEHTPFVFKAQPMPSPAPSTLPAVPKKPPTKPEPFNFHLDDKDSKHNSLNLSTNTIPVFKAQPATVLEKRPFIPEKSSKQTVEIKEFNLQTDIRAIQRQQLKEINDIKEHEKELALQRLRELQEEEERKEIQKLRKDIVHKAQPIKHFKPIEIKPSNRLPTQPLSPKFKTDERLQLRHQNS